MIDCSNEYIYYKKKRLVKKKGKAFLLLVLTLTILLLFYNFFITPQLCEICNDYAYSICNESLNSAVIVSLNDSVNYSQLISIEKNNSGEIIMISSNSHKINLLSRNIEKLALERLKAELKKGVKIPFWAFSGIKILSGYGKEIQFNYLSVSSVNCSFMSEFKSVGINQTLHSIYVELRSDVNIEIPLLKKESEYKTSILIAETVLVGKIPEVYLNGNLFS